MPFIGELAALATSFFYSVGPTFFTMAGKLVGSVVVNRTRLVVALVYLFIAHWLIYGTPLPIDASPDRWFWLGLSGVIGFVLGDAALFQSFIVLGTRLTMLIFAINPIFAAVLAWLFLGESLTAIQLLGMSITLAGIAWVMMERSNPSKQALSPKDYANGIFLAVLAALGQAAGSVTAKMGLYGDFHALSGQIIRVGVGTVAIWVLTLLGGKARQTIEALKSQPKAVQQILIASFLGPFLGVFFSLVAIQNAEVGIASTLMSLQPVFLIPIGYYFFKERISWQAIAGTVVTLAGVAVIFLV
ncbi:DMT family transporter [bacterium]|nr:DMT family transporter [bacterium]MCB2179286.1 DMT family transporter [bacterium]